MKRSVMKIVLAIVLSLIMVCNLQAQQDAMFTQYMFNGLALNPAYAGTHESLEFAAIVRDQWTGLPGAPSTQTLSLHSPLHNRNIGLGFMLINDKIGISRQTGAYAAYAYKVRMNDRGVLSMGLQAGFTIFNEDLSEALPTLKSQLDPNFLGEEVNTFMPNFGVGLYYHTEKFFIGASSPHIVQNRFYKAEIDSLDSRQERHYFIHSGVVLPINDSFKLKPSTLIKYVAGAPIQVDVNLNLLIEEKVWIGVSYRSFDTFNAMFQINLSDQLQIGYSYDFATFTELSQVHGGSHEILINYRLKPKYEGMLTPRYF
jgi:type IX secretion system PorP/SprF family membrane protein